METATGGVSCPCQGVLDDSQGARVDVWSGWKRAGVAAHRALPATSRSVGCGRNLELWAVGCGNFPAKGSEIHGRAEGADLRAARSADTGVLVYGITRLRVLSPPGARSVGAAARLPLRHHRAHADTRMMNIIFVT